MGPDRRGARITAALLVPALLGPALLLAADATRTAAQETGGSAGPDTASTEEAPVPDTAAVRDTVPADTASPRMTAPADTSSVPDSAGGTAADGPERSAEADTGGGATYRREIFTYPTGGRTDPFRPLELDQGMGPRFENLVLAGVIHAPEVGSVAILRDRSTGSRHRVRDGERIGNARVVEIRPDAVVFSVRGVAGPRREILPARRQEEENQP